MVGGGGCSYLLMLCLLTSQKSFVVAIPERRGETVIFWSGHFNLVFAFCEKRKIICAVIFAVAQFLRLAKHTKSK